MTDDPNPYDASPDELKALRKYEDHRELVVGYAAGQVGVTDPSPYYESALPGAARHSWPKHWCGIFCLWALHEAGLALDWEWDFKPAEKKWGFLWRLRPTSNPQPGDIAYFERYQHHAIVERVDAHTAWTIDGNQAGGVVARRERPRARVHAFFSIEPLLGDTPP